MNLRVEAISYGLEQKKIINSAPGGQNRRFFAF